MPDFSKTAAAIIAVGDGRGFVVGDYVITAAHCLPWFPPCMSASYTEERTYKRLLAPLGDTPHVWAECLFADPIGDIAVLGTPDSQELWNESLAYNELVSSVTPLSLADARSGEDAWLLSRDGSWFQCSIQCQEHGPLWLMTPDDRIVSGMSGSPVISGTGSAIGIVCVSSNTGSESDQCGAHGPNPSLSSQLPGWFLRELAQIEPSNVDAEDSR